MSYDILNSNLDLRAGGFGEQMFIGQRLTGSRGDTSFVDPTGLNAIGAARITAYDSSGNARITTSNNGNRSLQINGLGGQGSVLIGDITTANGTSYASILTLQSTTQGFLPPRMTETQINAIATPAEGLVVFNTTTSHLCVYQSGGWVKMNHSPM
jgi:hypothetical protein